MRKKYFILLILSSFLSCKKDNSKLARDQEEKIDNYMQLIKDSKLSNETKTNYLNNAFLLIKKRENSSINRNNLSEIAFQYYSLNRLDKFKKTSLELLKLSELANDTTKIAKANRYLGGYYKEIKRYDSSFIYYIEAEKFYKELRDQDDYFNILTNIGMVKYNINDFYGAELILLKAFNYYKKSNNIEKLIVVTNQLGLVENELKNYDLAIDYFNKALQILIANKNEYQKSICYNNIGLVYQNLKDFKKAKKNYEFGLINKEIKKEDPELYALLVDNLAYSKLKLGETNNILPLFRESMKIRYKLKYIPQIVLNQNHLSEYYSNIGDDINAIKYSKLALELAKKSNEPLSIISSLKQASLVDKENSTKYSEDYIRISDSLQLEERKNKDRFARIEFETDELRQENTQLSEQNRDILNYFMIAIVFGGFLFFARFQRLKARELALKQTQQQANEEIYRLIISHQNQLEEGRDLEKKRISKELHDGVLGRLFGLRLNLDGLNNFDDEETKQQRLEYLNELKIIEQDLREISHELSRENLVLINNFVAIINNLLEQQTKINTAKINTLISDKIDWEKVSNTIKINLYRILQESLQNINKHAEAKTINVIFNKDSKGNLIFSIEDDGKGYNTNGKKTKGIGVNNIVERVHQCQGKIDIKSQIGKGTKIIITFPLENETINV